MLGRSYMPGGKREFALHSYYPLTNHCPFPCSDSTIKPGPGAHSPEKVFCNKPSAAKHSLGIRHSEYVYTPLEVKVQQEHIQTLL